MKLRSGYRAVFGFCVVFGLVGLQGCSNAFQDMEQRYREGRYLEAAQSALDGYRNPELRPKVQTFLLANGETLLNQINAAGESLLKQHTAVPVDYYGALNMVLEQLNRDRVSISNLDAITRLAAAHYQTAVTNYCQAEYELGKSLAGYGEFRAALYHLKTIQKYKAQYLNTLELIQQMDTLAARRLAVVPLYKPADLSGAILGDTLTYLLNNSRRFNPLMGTLLRLQSVDVPEAFNNQFMTYLNATKTEFITPILDTRNTAVQQSDYYLQGVLDATETLDLSQIATTGLSAQTTSNAATRLTYTVKVRVDAALFISNTEDQVTRISFYESDTGRQDYPGKAPGYYPREQIVNNAVRKAAKRLCDEVLDVIDKDKDPVYFNQQINNRVVQ